MEFMFQGMPAIKQINELANKDNETMHLALIDVHESAGKVVTTSRNVAAVFGKEHKNVLADIRNILNTAEPSFAGLNFQPIEYKDKNGDMRPEYLLTRDGCMLLIMGYTGAKAMQLKTAYIKRFNEMEQVLKENALREQALKTVPLPDFTNPAEAARAWADRYESELKALAERDEAFNQRDRAVKEKEAAVIECRITAEQRDAAVCERDKAIRTKAWISGKKTATALGKAGGLTKENNKLKEQLGIGRNFKTCKAIDWLADVFDLKRKGAWSAIGKALSKRCKEAGAETKPIEDPSWGTVNAYPVAIIDAFKQAVLSDQEMLKKYRI